MESFASRVDKVFGSLQVSSSSSWRLSPYELPQQERPQKQPSELDDDQEDQQEDDDERPCWASTPPTERSSFEGMEVEDDPEGEGRAVRQMIGLDSTLDNEDEEDEFDKAAFGLDGSEEDRLYMKGIQEDKRVENLSKSLPSSLDDLKSLRRDPRANHFAARARLEEDAKAAAATCTTVVSTDIIDSVKVSDVEVVDAMVNVTRVKRSSENIPASEEEAPVASSAESLKPSKRVRFAPDPEKTENPKTNTGTEFVRPKLKSLRASQVPDYVRNPSKYTCYTLDWSVEDNDMSNFEAFRACSETLHKKVEEEHFPQQKIQFVRKHERISSSPQKISAEEPKQSCMAIGNMICLGHLEDENGKLDDEVMKSKTVDAASNFCEAVENMAGKSAKKYRTRRDPEDQMDI